MCVPFKSKKQEQYLRLNEPEVYSDWKNKYGSYKGAESFEAERTMKAGTIRKRLLTAAQRIGVTSNRGFSSRGLQDLMEDAGYKQIPERGLSFSIALTGLIKDGYMERYDATDGTPMFRFIKNNDMEAETFNAEKNVECPRCNAMITHLDSELKYFCPECENQIGSDGFSEGVYMDYEGDDYIIDGQIRQEKEIIDGKRVRNAETFNAQTATPISPPSKAPKCKCVANRDDATWDERRLGVKGITMSGPFYDKENGKEKAYWACQYCGPQWEDKLVLESEATATMKSALYSLTAVGVGVFIFNRYVKDRLPKRGEE